MSCSCGRIDGVFHSVIARSPTTKQSRDNPEEIAASLAESLLAMTDAAELRSVDPKEATTDQTEVRNE